MARFAYAVRRDAWCCWTEARIVRALRRSWMKAPAWPILRRAVMAGAHSGGVRLFGLSFLMLFLELALIRWTGSNVLYLSYFSNFILLASFLGIGLGFLRSDARRDLFRFAPVGLAALIAFVRIFPVEIDRSGTELVFFGALGTKSGLPPWL